MAKVARPLSPHLQIYRWYVTMALSIAHRVSGAALAVGLVFLAWWLVALANGAESFAAVEGWKDSPLGVLFLFGYSFLIYFHLANGLRYLGFDLGYGFEPEQARQSGIIALAAASALTLVTWFAIAFAG